ncbi:MAG: sulfur carrier protein ThiS [Desulfobacterales bacterium]|jgi:thiamine biosynthesis protein ThiS
MIQVAGKKLPWHKGMTVSELLNTLNDPHPYAVVRINEQYITRPNFEQTIIPDDAEVFLIPMIAGG